MGYISDCNSDVSTLPDHLWKGLSVDGPRDFQIKTFVEEDYYYSMDNSTYAMPGIRFIWKVPASGKIITIFNYITLCFMLHLYHTRLSSIPKMKFAQTPFSFSLSTRQPWQPLRGVIYLVDMPVLFRHFTLQFFKLTFHCFL